MYQIPRVPKTIHLIPSIPVLLLFLLTAAHACAQQDYVGRYDIYNGYAALIALAVESPYLGRWMQVFAPKGRTAFSNYILQSLIFGWIFFGYGLGQFNRVSMRSAFLLGSAVYVAQIIASILWLRWFRFGPLEWVWRSLTYGWRQPMWNRG